MAKHIIWHKEITGQQSVGICKIAETDSDLEIIKNYYGNEYFNQYFETTVSESDTIWTEIQEGERYFNGGTKDNPTWNITGTDIYQNSSHWCTHVEYTKEKLEKFVLSNPNHIWTESVKQWIFYLNTSKNDCLSFSYPYSDHNVMSYCKTLLNSNNPTERAFSPLQIP